MLSIFYNLSTFLAGGGVDLPALIEDMSPDMAPSLNILFTPSLGTQCMSTVAPGSTIKQQ